MFARIAAILPFIAFVSIFTFGLAACRHLLPSGILFYQGTLLACLTGVLHGFWSAWRRRKGATPFKDAAISFLIAYSFMFTVPTTVDRSYSVQLLTMLSSHPEGIREEVLAQHFTSRFLEDGGVDRRIAEQSISGNVEVDTQEGKVRLTSQGWILVQLFAYDCRIFVCNDPGPRS